MKLVSLEQFQRLTALSDKSLVWLLTKNLLPCQSKPGEGLQVDLESVEIAKLQEAILARQAAALEERSPEISEQLGNIVRDELEILVNEALGKYLGEEEN